MLYIFCGLPGSGKTTLATALARRERALYLRADTIEQALRDGGVADVGPLGYMAAYAVAAENLRLGQPVVADTVNPLAITRQAWRNVAVQSSIPFIEIEVVCSDETEHRARVETRRADIAGFALPTWADVQAWPYEPWTTDHLVIDTVGRSIDETLLHLFKAINDWMTAKHDHPSPLHECGEGSLSEAKWG